MKRSPVDFSDLEEYRRQVAQQPRTAYQKIELDIIDQALTNLKSNQ